MFENLRDETRSPYAPAIFSADLKAGITLTASFVPTAMALGVISGLGPLAGLPCGVPVGIVAAVCGGTRAPVSGPGAVLAVVTATLVAGDRFSLPEIAIIVVMAGAERLEPVPVGLPVPVLEMPSLEFLPEAVGPAALIAPIGSVYTLMWSLIADTFTNSQRNPNRGLVAQGLGNLAAGAVGVLDRIPKDRIVESEEEAGTLAWSLVKRP